MVITIGWIAKYFLSVWLVQEKLSCLCHDDHRRKKMSVFCFYFYWKLDVCFIYALLYTIINSPPVKCSVKIPASVQDKNACKSHFHQCGIFFLISLDVVWLKIRPKERSDRTVYHILDKLIQKGKPVGKSNYSRKCIATANQTLLHIM